jgi:hypothetical protein
MKASTGRFFASLILTVAWLATGSTAGAVTPLPYSPYEPRKERDVRVETARMLPEWAFADLATSPRGEPGFDYFAGSLQGMSSKDEHALGDAKEKKEKKAKKAKKPKKPKKHHGGTPSDEEPGDWPILTDPPGQAHGEPGGEGPPGGEVPEPSGSALLAIAMVGFLVTLRTRRSR